MPRLLYSHANKIGFILLRMFPHTITELFNIGCMSSTASKINSHNNDRFLKK